MHNSSRTPNPSDGSTDVKATDGGGSSDGGPPASVRGARLTARRSSDGGEQSSAHATARGDPNSDKPDLSPSGPRRMSSGYFSNDSPPSSPFPSKPEMADRATQTPILTDQEMARWLYERNRGAGMCLVPSSCSPRPRLEQLVRVRGMQEEQAEAFGQQLRLIGDEFNQILMQRRDAARQREDVFPLNLLRRINQQPVTALCVSLVLLVIGRIMYLQGSSNGQNHSQV